MGEAANLGMVALAAFIVLKISGMKLELPKFPTFELPQFGLEQITEYRERGDYYRDLLDEHSTNLENILARDPFPEIPDVDITPPEVYGDKLTIMKERAAHFREVGDVLETGILEQLGALELGVAELGEMIGGDHDAGGSTNIYDSGGQVIGLGIWPT